MNTRRFLLIGIFSHGQDMYMNKPGKHSGMVIFNRQDYFDKMDVILNDSSKCIIIFHINSCDSRLKIEARLQRRLLSVYKSKLLSKMVQDYFSPLGSQRSRVYGLPKVHKKSISLRPILCMVGSVQHGLVRWLVESLHSGAYLFSPCVYELFRFSSVIRNSYLCSEEKTHGVLRHCPSVN